MEEIKGMSEAEARKRLMRLGYGLGEIDEILNTAPAVDPNAEATAALMRQGYGHGEAADLAAAEATTTPAPKAAPAPKAEPAPAPVAKAAPKAPSKADAPVKAVPKASK